MSTQDSEEDLEHRDMEAIESHRMDLLEGWLATLPTWIHGYFL